MATLNQMPNYFADMKVVDSRITKLEKGYEEISQLLTSLSIDIKHIIGGNSGIKEETQQGRKSKSKV